MFKIFIEWRWISPIWQTIHRFQNFVYNMCSPSYYYKSELNSVTGMLQGQFFAEEEEEEEEDDEEEENYTQNGPDEDEFILSL